MRCLVVEPSAVMGRILVNILAGAGFEAVEIVPDAASAMEKLREAHGEQGTGDATPPDVILASGELPGEDCLEFVKQLRAESWGATLPVCLISARNAREDVEAAREAGVQGYVLRPFTGQGLLERVLPMLRRDEDAEPERAAA